jgi:hypothetical protein
MVPPAWRDSFACYTLATGKGQTATLKLTCANSETAFTITDVIDYRVEDSFKTEARTCQIDIYQMSRVAINPAPFTLYRPSSFVTGVAESMSDQPGPCHSHFHSPVDGL